MMRAPYSSTARRLKALALSGITTQAGRPRRRAARASAAPWLPEEWVATPRLKATAGRLCTALLAPRSLNAPISWKFSHLKNTSAPVSASSRGQRSTGVRRTCGAIRSAAARMAAISRICCMHISARRRTELGTEETFAVELELRHRVADIVHGQVARSFVERTCRRRPALGELLQ